MNSAIKPGKNETGLCEIELWLLWLPPGSEKIDPPPEEAEKILDRQELHRYQHIVSSGKRAEFFHSRLLLKKIVEHYLPEQAAEIVTRKDDLGRPFWYFRQQKIPLYFSLSHTRGAISCAVARRPEIGCDIEIIRPRRYEEELAVKVLGKNELHHYRAQCDQTLARQFFYKCWTLKEAHLKAKGTGIRASLAALDFGGEVGSNRFSPVVAGREKWQLYHRFSSEYSLSVATRGEGVPTLQENFGQPCPST